MAKNEKGLTPIGDLLPGDTLQHLAADLVISRQKLKQADGIELIRLKREQGTQNLGFSSRPFVLCGLPLRRPPKNVLLHRRRNGHFILDVTAHPDFGLPFGQDRLIPIFLATLAVRQQSRTIQFSSAAEMLDTFGLAHGGNQYRRLIASCERIFGSTIFFRTESQTDRAKVIDRGRFNFLSEARLWYARDPQQKFLPGEFQNSITLSAEFYQEVTSHPIPTDLDVVREFAGAPAVLDLFMWLAYRCFRARGRELVPLFGEYGLAGQLGVAEYSRPRRFRQKLDQWLGPIRAAWPDCPAEITQDGNSLAIGRAFAIRPPE